MYADRRSPARHVNPGSLAAAVAINGAALAALIYSTPEIFVKPLIEPLITYRVPPEPIPDPIPSPVRSTQAKPLPQRAEQPAPQIDRTPTAEGLTLFTGGVDIDDFKGAGTGTGNVTLDPPPPPIAIDPVLDQRYAGSFQPDYPADEARAEHEGVVVVRVLIGVDGRVKQIERVSATSDSFFRATMRRALSAWRFRPGTLGGIPVERWRQIRVSFHLQGE